MKKVFVLIGLVVVAMAAYAQQDSSLPPVHGQTSNHEGHKCPMAGEQSRAGEGMGFSQSKTTHHFLLTKDGGVISVEANGAKDTSSRDEVRMHLAHIAKAFSEGDFDIPMFVHDQVPPGVPVMKARKDKISYRFENSDQGGRVVITTTDAEALAAIHDFLVFQGRAHKTNDATAVE